MYKETEKIKKAPRRLIAAISAFIILVAAVLISGALIMHLFKPEPPQAEFPPDQAESETTGAEDEQKESEPPVMMARFEELFAQNSDLVGWIRVPNTTINYPVVYCRDNAFYLDHDFDKKPSSAGTPFLDTRADLLEKNQSLSTYGHQLTHYKDLQKYKSLDYYKENPLFAFDSLYEEGVYKIFAVFYMAGNASDKLFYNYMKAGFDSEEDFQNHINQLTARSIFLTTVDINPGDRLVLLTTCTDETDNLRLIVAGRKIRPGERYRVDTENAVLNPAPLYPQKWYDAKGGSPPDLPFI